MSQVLSEVLSMNVRQPQGTLPKPTAEVGRDADSLSERGQRTTLPDYPIRKWANESCERSFRRSHQDHPVVHGVLHDRLLSRIGTDGRSRDYLSRSKRR
jgi:hypothetical protein